MNGKTIDSRLQSILNKQGLTSIRKSKCAAKGTVSTNGFFLASGTLGRTQPQILGYRRSQCRGHPFLQRIPKMDRIRYP